MKKRKTLPGGTKGEAFSKNKIFTRGGTSSKDSVSGLLYEKLEALEKE